MHSFFWLYSMYLNCLFWELVSQKNICRAQTPEAHLSICGVFKCMLKAFSVTSLITLAIVKYARNTVCESQEAGDYCCYQSHNETSAVLWRLLCQEAQGTDEIP